MGFAELGRIGGQHVGGRLGGGCTGGHERLLEGGDDVGQFGGHIGLGVAAHAGQEAALRAAHVRQQLAFEAANIGHGQAVEVALGTGEHDHDLLFHGHRTVERLLEQLDQAVATLELRLGDGVELGAEGGERLQLAELSKIQLQGARHALHRFDLCRATHA